MTKIAETVKSLVVGEIVILTMAHKKPITGERVVETQRAVVRWIDLVVKANLRGRPVIGFGYSPAWNEPSWCGHGVYFAPTTGPEPEWSIIDIQKTGQTEPKQPAPFTPRPGDPTYDSMH